ncbi:MAG: protein translocase subunit SecD [Rhodospirillales bacterium]|jgi:preprotein translocase subunit SecD|nr:protein translocase subunit SecD [Rhodospirillales bacterium]
MSHFPTWKIVLILAVAAFGALAAAPNLVSRQAAEALPDWIPHRQISLGLDLQGGSHLLLDVDTGALIRERLESMVEAVRAELRGARIRYEQLGIAGKAVQVTIPEAADRARVEEILRKIEPGTEIESEGDGRITMGLSDQAIAERETAAVEQSLEIIRRRIDETGVREPTIQRQGRTRILVQLPGVDDPERVKRLIGKTAKMTFHLVDDGDLGQALAGRPPPGTMLLPLIEDQRPGQQPQQLLVNKRVLVSGENLIAAEPTFQNNEAVVSFRFDSLGARRFGEATTQNVDRLLAIVLDNQVISAPRIREPIIGGSGIISGTFSVEDARDLALLLRAGALPAPLTVIEERTVGAGLGADSIEGGKLAGVVGMILVAGFMILAYGFFGVLAVFAVVVNIVLLLGALSLLQATLTLPGIAGIVLTAGMAVDANVLIYEHVREEVRNGRSALSALDAGFTRAMTTILDSNLTTLIAGIVLYVLGSGPVRGFAVTLSIGILTTMFTAVSVTRLMTFTWYRRTRPQVLPI